MVDTAYQGEAMLLRWGDNNTAGRTVTFQIEEDSPLHPFKGFPSGKNGQRFMLAVVPLNDEQMPDDDAMAKAEKKRFRDLPRSQQAGMLCADPAFQAFLRASNSEDAAKAVRAWCGVNSRAEFDRHGDGSAESWDILLSEYEQRTGRLAEKR